MRLDCNDCGTPIPAGMAVMRSVGLERVAYHRECWSLNHVSAPPVIPAQRSDEAAVEPVR